jgi:uncharacterized protein (TIGR01370 family)
MYTDWIQRAYQSGAEFVTEADLASRIESFAQSDVTTMVNGNVITATVSSSHAGDFALDVTGQGSQVIENVGNWYAYDSNSVFVPETGGSFTITLGAAADDVTHITSLPMRGDLLAVTGDGLNLAFSVIGEGLVVIQLGQIGNKTPVVTGAAISSFGGDLLDLTLTGLDEHDVSLRMVPPPTEIVSQIAFSADTGSSATDFVTNSAEQTLSGTLSTALAAGDAVQVSLDNGTTWLTAAAAAGAATFSLAGVTLTGSNTLMARVVNSDGVANAALVQAFVLDQVPPAPPSVPHLMAASDSGTSDADDITNVANPAFTGTAEAGATVTLFVGTTAVGTDVAAASGEWTITASGLADGTHSVVAKATDSAGNSSSASASIVLTLDTIAPTVTAALTNDTGTPADGITRDPAISGTGEANATVTLTVDGAEPITTITDGSGTWTFTPSVADGTHTVVASQTDAAGNTGSTTVAFTLDTTAPPAPSAPDLVAASDTGPSSTDNITSVTIPTVTGNGAEAGATVTLYDTDGMTVLGTAIADGSGNWSITSSALSSGDHALTAKQTDLAGNVSVASAALTVTVTPPKTSIYVLQGINPAVIGAAPFDVKAIGLYGDNEQLFTAAQVSQMGGGPGGGLLLGYLSVGEAETYRDYFATIPPADLGPEDPNFPGSYQVAYWSDAWRSITTSYIDRMIAAGFDGAVLDVVDEYQQPWAQSNAPAGDAAGAMVDLVKYLSDYAHQQNSNFEIWVNGAEPLLDNSTYLQSIDGVFKESLFYDGAGHTQPVDATSHSLGFLDEAMAANKSVINIEYVTGAAQIADVHAKDAAAGIGSYIAHLDLNGIDMEGVPPGLTVPAPASVTIGNGSDMLVLSMSEDAYLGDAQFTVAVDGVQLAGTFTTTALHTFGTSQTFTFGGDWEVGAHTVTVRFLNDAYAGTPSLDRNLYVNGISYDGTTGLSADLKNGVPISFSVTDTTPVTGSIIPPVITGSGPDQLVLSMSEDAYEGDAQFTVAVDGLQLGGTFATTVQYATGASQSFIFNGDWAVGAHTVTVNFLNDAYAGTPDTDRNLYVNGVGYDGTATFQSAALMSGGPRSFAVTDIGSPGVIGSGSDTLVLGMSEDAYKGDAQFTVAVDGIQLAGTFTATALHSAGASQSFTFDGDWGIGNHTVTVELLNDLYAGTPDTNRNLYMDAISYDGTNTNQSAAVTGFVPNNFTVTDTTAIPSTAILPPPVSTGSGSDTLVLSMSEDAYKGDAQFTVSVDGRQLGGTFATTAWHAAGESQSFIFKGDFGTGQHTVAVDFLNDAYAGTASTDRNLYVNGVSYNGTATGQTLALMAGGPKTFAVSGGTTPSVSEVSDHGTLQESLSQVGSYNVGGDVVMLDSGNVGSVTLGSGASQISFIGASAITLTGGSGTSVVASDTGNNTFIAGTGGLDVTGGGGADAYVFHASSGLLTIEDFSLAKGDTLTVDTALQAALVETSDGKGGTMLSFGSAGQGVDIRGITSLPSANILWV